jgi:hypothetical protein
VPLELDPAQPQPVVQAIERLLAADAPPVDPWWAAGLAEALRSGDGAAAEEAWGGAGVVEP